MSSGGNPPQDNTPPQDGRRGSADRTSSNIIEFVDSQDPNVRSAIQRHTAYHSAAQRRDARSRLLRRSSQARYLEWTRRPRTENEVATSSASSTSSVAISPAPSPHERSERPTRAPSAEREPDSNPDQAATEAVSETTSVQAGTSANDAVLEFCKYSSPLNPTRHILQKQMGERLTCGFSYLNFLRTCSF